MKTSPLSRFTVERLSLISDKPFASVLAAVRDGIGHPDMDKFWAEIWSADSFQKVESIVKPALGPTDLMEFGEFDDGAFIRKDISSTNKARRSSGIDRSPNYDRTSADSDVPPESVAGLPRHQLLLKHPL